MEGQPKRLKGLFLPSVSIFSVKLDNCNLFALLKNQTFFFLKVKYQQCFLKQVLVFTQRFRVLCEICIAQLHQTCCMHLPSIPAKSFMFFIFSGNFTEPYCCFTSRLSKQVAISFLVCMKVVVKEYLSMINTFFFIQCERFCIYGVNCVQHKIWMA